MATLFFSFGGLFQVGWGSSQQEPAFGGMQDNTSVKAKMINLINSVRTLMRSMCEKQRVHKQEGTSRLTEAKPAVPLIFLNVLIIVWAIAFG
ncbi:hypothetical protein D0865_15078 [Hortaea werneckii]|uniref:Stress-associated endoplasmic reticulum protein n=1 Tax=Hortaea werneckii TaxID=91943 RepID=A0A3M7AUE0_HORWE|nr:hypothetical protein D0865_15078 [Hortaea werneckii]